MCSYQSPRVYNNHTAGHLVPSSNTTALLNSTIMNQSTSRMNSMQAGQTGIISVASRGEKVFDGTDMTNNDTVHNQYGAHISAGRVIGHCAECGLRISNLSEACHAMGYLYHNNCFVCCCCKRTLRGKVFYKDQDNIYCEEDYLYCGFQQKVEKCVTCGHVIAETILIALGNTYHPGCFRCCVCTKCLDGIPFTKDNRNYIYCLTDYYLVHGSLCSGCGLAIIPENGSDEVKYVMALERQFHIDCYRCRDCKRLLGDEPENRCYPFNESDPAQSGRLIQRLLCLNCHLQRIGAVPATSANTLPLLTHSTSASTFTNSGGLGGMYHNSTSTGSNMSDYLRPTSLRTTMDRNMLNTSIINGGKNKIHAHFNRQFYSNESQNR